VQRRYQDFRRLGAEILVVAHVQPEAVAASLRDYPLPFPMVADPEGAAFRAFGLERTSWGTMLRPRVILRYLRLMLRGWRARKPGPGEDVLRADRPAIGGSAAPVRP
jgi:hypothetical protein